MKRPVTLIIASALTLILVLFAGIWPLAGGDQLIGAQGGAFTNRDGRNFGQDGQMLPQGTPSADQSQMPQPQNNNGQGQNPPGMGNGAQGGMQAPTNQGVPGSQPAMMQTQRILQYCLYVLIIVLGLIALGGLWLSKPWGTVVAIVASAVVIATSAIGLFRMISTISLIENIVKMLIAIAVIVLVLLPKKKEVKTEAVKPEVK